MTAAVKRATDPQQTVLARYGYDPHLGRWLSEDPIGLAGGINLFGYVESNPVALVDPDGLSPVAPAAGIGGLIGGPA